MASKTKTTLLIVKIHYLKMSTAMKKNELAVH